LSQLTQVDRKSVNNPGHLITDYAYDSVGRLVDINNQFNTTNISHYGYNYDDGNRLTTKGGTDGSSTVDYGKDNQISAVDNATRPDEAYNFNALGIRSGWVTDTLDSRRVLNDGKYQYQYDDEGNLTQKQELVTGKLTSYAWDYRNRLTKVVSGSQVVEYLYDAEDRRVGKKINGVVTEKYVYDGADIALVVNAAGTIVERYLYGDGTDNVLSRQKGGAVVWSLGDRQGSVVDLVDGNGTVLNHFVYDSFGNRTGTTTADFRFGYTGRELDGETGLYYYRARYYDPMLGRFISEDPVGFSAGDTNLYRYVNNSPTNFTDPTGEFAFLPILGVMAVGALFAGAANVISQDIKILEGSQEQFSWGQFGSSLATGAGFGLAAATSPIIAGGLFAYGVVTGTQHGLDEWNKGNKWSGAFDIASSLLPVLGAKKFAGEISNLPGGFKDAHVAWWNKSAGWAGEAWGDSFQLRANKPNNVESFEQIANPWDTPNLPNQRNTHGNIEPNLSDNGVPDGWIRLTDGSIRATPSRMLPSGNYVASSGQNIYRVKNPRIGSDTNNLAKPPQELLDAIPSFYDQLRSMPGRQRSGSGTIIYDLRLGKTYTGASGSPYPTEVSNLLPVIEKSQLYKGRDQVNCGEFKAFSEALLNGSRPEDLHMYTFNVQGKRQGTINNMAPCLNCDVTFNKSLIGQGVNVWSWDGQGK
jgi:RHS repeat-associated protein